MSTGSKATRSISRFALADIEEVISKGSAVKKEKPLLILPKPIKLSPLLGKKGKTSESWELSLETSKPVEILKRLGSFMQEASDLVLRYYDSLKARAEKAEEDLKEQAKIFQEQEKVFKEQQKSLVAAVEDLKGKLERTEKDHAKEMESAMVELKTSAAVAILEAKLQIYKEDPTMWDPEKWRAALERLVGGGPSVGKDPVRQGEPTEEEKEEAAAGSDA